MTIVPREEPGIESLRLDTPVLGNPLWAWLAAAVTLLVGEVGQRRRQEAPVVELRQPAARETGG